MFTRTAEEYETLWNPRLVVYDASECETLLDADTAWNFTNKDTGEVKYTQRYRATISIATNLANFPFDHITVALKVGCTFYPTSKVVLSINPAFDNIEVKHSLADWLVDKTGSVALSVLSPIPTKSFSVATLSIFLRRRYKYYIYKILSVCSILVSWSWVVFWMDPTAFADRMSIALTLFLAAVTFLVSVDASLPKVDFLTKMDKMLLYVMAMIFMTAVESFASYCLSDNPVSLDTGACISSLEDGSGSGDSTEHSTVAAWLDYTARWLFPLTFALTLSLTILVGSMQSNDRSI